MKPETKAALEKVREHSRTALFFTADEIEHPDRRALAGAVTSAVRSGLIYHDGYRKRGGRPVAVYMSRNIDLGADFPEEHWLRLAKQYVRYHIANKAREGFRTQDVMATAIGLGCPQPKRIGLWRKAIAQEGMIEQGGRWKSEPCCDDCGEAG